DGQVVSDTALGAHGALVAPMDGAGGKGGEGRGAMSPRDRGLGLQDGLRVASVGLRARPLRAALSALGIAIGTAALVAVLGLFSFSQAGLLAEIDRLGTNMLTLEACQSITGQPSKLPLEAPARI